MIEAVFHALDFKFVLGVFLHEFLLLAHLLLKHALSVCQSVLELSDLNRCDVSEHFLVFNRHCVPFVIQLDVDGLGELGGIPAQRMMSHLLRSVSCLLIIFVDRVSPTVLVERHGASSAGSESTVWSHVIGWPLTGDGMVSRVGLLVQT